MRIIETPRPQPPAWMIAPSFREIEEPISARAPQAAGSASQTAPYRSVREVPRFS
ncbi:hypothetical protein [Rhizorhabdus dicambivorans]|nr:hypothetical protein [Rhizorhabdus dicambivorans]